MLNDKEKQTISKLREIIEYDKKHRLETIYDKEQIEFRNNIEFVLDLVEKLKKENEELKNKVAKRNNELIELDETSEKEFLTKQEVKENYIPKDKVRDFIKRLEKDVENIREKKKDSHDYDRSSSRIQAYLTKTNEIIKRLKELLVED